MEGPLGQQGQSLRGDLEDRAPVAFAGGDVVPGDRVVFGRVFGPRGTSGV